MKHRNLLLVLGIVSSMSAVARDFEYTYEGQTLTYTVIDEDAKTCETKAGSDWTTGNNVSGALVIPEKVNDGISDYTVTSIGDWAFYECRSLTSVEIPNSVTSIGERAFSYCVSLTSIEIPNSVTSIEDWAFYSCSSFTSVEIPNSVTSIGNSAFNYCSSLTSVEIPNSVTSIGDWAFSDCYSLTSMIIPPSVTSIGEGVFPYNLVKCAYPNNLQFQKSSGRWIAYNPEGAFIEDGFVFGPDKTAIYFAPLALDGDYSIPNSVTTIGEYAFEDCRSLASIEIPNSVTSIGDGAFINCVALTSINLPNSVTSICERTFDRCSGLTSVVIPNSVTSIGERAFVECSGLTSVVIPNSVTSIDNGAFIACSGLTSVVIPNSVTSIDGWVFSGCSGLTSVVIPNSVTSIGDYAFYLCTGLTSIEIPNSVTSIGESFKYCSGLKTVVLPNSITSINYEAFDNCLNLVKSAYPNNIPNPFRSGLGIGYDPTGAIVEDGFVYGPEKKAVYFAPFTLEGEFTLDENITAIGDMAFAGCDRLDKVKVMADLPPVMAEGAFDGLYGKTELSVPSGALGNYLAGNWSLFDKISVAESGQMLKDYSDDLLTYRLDPYGRAAFIKSGQYASSVSIPTSVNLNGDGVYFVKGIGYKAFDGVRIGDVVFSSDSRIETIGEYAFRETRITSLNLPSTVERVQAYAFSGCDRMRTATFGSSLKSIGDYAFQGFNGLQKVVLPPSLETIGDYAFAYSPSLTTVTMGHNVKSIGNYAFCESPVVVIYITAPQPPMADNNTFSNYNANLWLPDKDAVAAYFDAPSCWYRFNTFEMIEPTGIEMTGDKKIDGVPGQQIQLKAVLQPGNVTLSAVFWRSTNPAVATVDANGLVTLSSGNGGMQTRSGEDSCMIIAESLYADGPIVEVPVHVEGLGVDEIESDGFGDSIDYTRPYEVYNMSGLKVADSTEGLTNGLYIIRQGSAAVKTMVNTNY